MADEAADEIGAFIPSSRPESIAAFSERRDALQQFKGYVYDQMVYLQAMGPDGQRILDNDELQIDDTTNVVYRVGQEFIIRGHEILYRGSASTAPDLDDPAYWEAKFGLFRAEGIRIKELRLARSAVYQAMNDLQRHGPAGQRVLDNDELYIAAPFDVRFRGKGDRNPGLQDPYYWEEKLEYFKDEYSRLNLPPRHTSHTSPMQKTPCSESSGRKRRRADENDSSNAVDGGIKRQRTSHGGIGSQQMDRSQLDSRNTSRPAAGHVIREPQSSLEAASFCAQSPPPQPQGEEAGTW